ATAGLAANTKTPTTFSTSYRPDSEISRFNRLRLRVGEEFLGLRGLPAGDDRRPPGCTRWRGAWGRHGRAAGGRVGVRPGRKPGPQCALAEAIAALAAGMSGSDKIEIRGLRRIGQAPGQRCRSTCPPWARGCWGGPDRPRCCARGRVHGLPGRGRAARSTPRAPALDGRRPSGWASAGPALGARPDDIYRVVALRDHAFLGRAATTASSSCRTASRYSHHIVTLATGYPVRKAALVSVSIPAAESCNPSSDGLRNRRAGRRA
ncbi:MAG: hypothetical protein MZV70_46630, partial [Desulfobacterales bacterium]|nr:hypothetical protein [Desulfobacterales bacterium]